MAKFTFNMPDVGEGVAEAEIVEWQVKVGDKVEEDQHLVDVMTDKATIDIESPVSGTVIEVAGEVGDTISVGAMLLVVEVEGDAADEAADDAHTADDAASEETSTDMAVPVAPTVTVSEPQPAPAPTPAPAPAPTEAAQPSVSRDKTMASPAVRRRARDLGVDLNDVKSADGGRVRHGDLDQFLAYNSGGGFSPAGKSRADEPVKVIGLRKRIAQNMSAAKRNIPHFTYVEECDVTDLEKARADLNAVRGQKPKLTMLPLLITAFCKMLPKYPMINARYDDEANIVTRHGSVHLGMATQTDNGLMVPVIRDAQARNLWQLAVEIGRLAQAARDGSAKSEELSGSTLTVTSLGPLGGVATTPVINRPEVAIIGPNRIIERPMFVTGADGQERIEKRKLMNISISCDHRVVDGFDAASFIQDVKKLIETPVLLLSD
ncbi:2-oxo acid dehydrogenase subunit E2 [Erythrobacter sp. Alg231-14]|uniref:2-oxo acid dehydrogenase subunit E2 n=1 Tax=Erythrobacter sp. Alg231-14 TaxID=1922225 RepID=UPI000D5537E4